MLFESLFEIALVTVNLDGLEEGGIREVVEEDEFENVGGSGEGGRCMVKVGWHEEAKEEEGVGEKEMIGFNEAAVDPV